MYKQLQLQKLCKVTGGKDQTLHSDRIRMQLGHFFRYWPQSFSQDTNSKFVLGCYVSFSERQDLTFHIKKITVDGIEILPTLIIFCQNILYYSLKHAHISYCFILITKAFFIHRTSFWRMFGNYNSVKI